MLMWASLSVVITQIQLNPSVLTYSCWYLLHWIMGKCIYWHWEGIVFTFLILLLSGCLEQMRAFMSCVAVIQRGGAALHFYPPVPAAMVGVLSLFSNAVFMATKTEEQTRAQIISCKLTDCCSSRGTAIFSIHINMHTHLQTYSYIYIPFIFVVMYFCMK